MSDQEQPKVLVYRLQSEDTEADFEKIMQAMTALAWSEPGDPEMQDLLRRIKEGSVILDVVEAEPWYRSLPSETETEPLGPTPDDPLCEHGRHGYDCPDCGAANQAISLREELDRR